jgi:hypothetical protein
LAQVKISSSDASSNSAASPSSTRHNNIYFWPVLRASYPNTLLLSYNPEPQWVQRLLNLPQFLVIHCQLLRFGLRGEQ